MRTLRRCLIVCLVALGFLAGWHLATRAQPTARSTDPQPAPSNTRFVFDVFESFDAKYEGDAPGYTGRGSLEQTRPFVALGDPVYRGESTPVGTITNVVWDRARGSLTVEFDPVPKTRVTVGDTVWILLAPTQVDKKSP